MINAVSRTALRRGVTHTAFKEIIDSFDRKLFSKITHPGHCLHHLLPPKTSAHCPYSWLRGTVVEHWSLTGELSLSYARPAADG